MTQEDHGEEQLGQPQHKLDVVGEEEQLSKFACNFDELGQAEPRRDAHDLFRILQI